MILKRRESKKGAGLEGGRVGGVVPHTSEVLRARRWASTGGVDGMRGRVVRWWVHFVRGLRLSRGRACMLKHQSS